MTSDLGVMTALVAGAAALPVAARRFRVPSSVLEIVYGIALFSFLIHGKPEWFTFMQEVGLIMLMFIAGMELHVGELFSRGRFQWYLVAVCLPFVLLPLACVKLGLPFYLGVVASVMSAGVIIPVLKEADLMRSPLGREAVALALTGEFLSIAALTALDVYTHYGLSVDALWSVAKIVGLFTLAVLFLKSLYLLAWWMPEKVESVMESEDPVEEGIRGVIFVALMGAFFALKAGVEPILGSFIAGVVFSIVFRSKGTFEHKVNAVGFGFFVPLFFIGVGADFDVGVFSDPESIRLAAIVTVMVFASNLPLFLFPLVIRMSVTEATAMALIVSSPLSMMIVAATLGMKAGLLDPAYYAPVVLASMASTLLYPSIFRPLGKRLGQKYREAA